MDKEFVGIRTVDGLSVMVSTEKPSGMVPLNPRYDLRNHSPTGFECGYNWSGPAQLALAILAEVAFDNVAERWYQTFKFEVVASMPQNESWKLRESDVVNWLEAIDTGIPANFVCKVRPYESAPCL